MTQKIRLESPGEGTLDTPIATITGWCTADDRNTPLTIRLDGRIVPHSLGVRPDVQRVFPGVPSFGFSASLGPEVCAEHGERELELRFELGEVRLAKTLRFSGAAVSMALEWERIKAAKRTWCLEALRCPVCRAARPVLDASGSLRCPGCDATMPQTTSALNALPEALYRRFQLKPTDNVSGHPHAIAVAELVDEVRRKGGKTLDCGAGLRTRQDESVINMEIVDYPSTDILAVGQSLPFADASFDLVLSLAVLEHVDDPFTCASELVRVAKPGGKIYCVVPFLQPEHGYPNHFFNMTRQGLASLFEGRARMLSHEVPRYAAPVYTLTWFVNEYLGSLPPAARRQFESMTIGEISRLKKDQYWKTPWVRQLSEEGNWRLASATAAVFVKDA